LVSFFQSRCGLPAAGRREYLWGYPLYQLVFAELLRNIARAAELTDAAAKQWATGDRNIMHSPAAGDQSSA
jgi:hypothetical protein